VVSCNVRSKYNDSGSQWYSTSALVLSVCCAIVHLALSDMQSNGKRTKRGRHKRKRLDTDDESEEDDDDQKLVTVSGSNVYFYAEVNKRTILYLNEKLDEATVNAVKYRSPITPPKIFLYIHSAGGDAFVGLSAMTHISNRPIPVVTIADGFVASAASLLLLSVKERYIMPNTHILIHQLRTGFWGKYDELLDEVTNSKLLMNDIINVYKNETRIPHRKLSELLKQEINLSTEQCINFGLVKDTLV